MKILAIIVILIGLASCRAPQPLVVEKVRTVTELEVVRDTVVHTEPDSASMQALLRCDSLGNVYMQQIVSLQTGRTLKPQIRIVDNIITLDCEVDSIAVYFQLRDRYTHTADTIYITKPPERERFFTKIARTGRNIIIYLILFVAIVAAIRYYRFINPFK
ncbi:MAG TPA: hypothetical protein ENN08_00200 [Bacteroidales bacterium]|nr:hypothetical protein [Bacteroidales bacterium]